MSFGIEGNGTDRLDTVHSLERAKEKEGPSIAGTFLQFIHRAAAGRLAGFDVPTVIGGAVEISSGVEDGSRVGQVAVADVKAVEDAFGENAVGRGRESEDSAVAAGAAGLRDAIERAGSIDRETADGEISIGTEEVTGKTIKDGFGPFAVCVGKAEYRATVVRAGAGGAPELGDAVQGPGDQNDSAGGVTIAAAAEAMQNGFGPFAGSGGS